MVKLLKTVGGFHTGQLPLEHSLGESSLNLEDEEDWSVGHFR